MHILFISDNFPPEVNAPASRTFEHCREWVNAGHDVSVITCAPNFPRGVLFPGYQNRLWAREELSGIRVIRVWSYISANKGFVRRTLDYMSFMVSSTIAGLLVRRFDVVIGTSPQFFAACGAWLVAAIRRRPFVFELRDLWPESIRAVGALRSGVLLRALERIELFLYRRAELVVSVTHAFRSNLAQRGIDIEKIQVITNGVDLSRFSPTPKDPGIVRDLGLEGCFVAGYIGTHGLAHGLETLLEAARVLAGRDDGIQYRMVLLGDGAAKARLKHFAAEMRLTNVQFLDTVPKDRVVHYWSVLDVCVVHLLDNSLFETVIPSKIFESMAMGVPLVHAVAGESARIVESEGAGVVVRSGDPQAIADAIVAFALDGGRCTEYAARAAVAARNYDRRHLAHSMLDALQSIVKKRQSGTGGQ